jgi:hypothetical protein
VYPDNVVPKPDIHQVSTPPRDHLIVLTTGVKPVVAFASIQAVGGVVLGANEE